MGVEQGMCVGGGGAFSWGPPPCLRRGQGLESLHTNLPQHRHFVEKRQPLISLNGAAAGEGGSDAGPWTVLEGFLGERHTD